MIIGIAHTVKVRRLDECMAWDKKWLDENQTTLVFTVKPESTWDDFQVAMNQFGFELGRSGKTLHAIIYNEYGFPKANPIPHVKSQMQKLAEFPNKGLLVTVTPKHSTSFLQSIVELIFRFMGQDMKTGVFVRTMDEAIKRVQQEQKRFVQSA